MITVEELRARGAIGELGLPLGTIATVEGTSVSGDSLRTKAAAGHRYLRVERVDGRTLQRPVLLWVSSGYEWVPAPGKTATFIAYETGGFSGAPDRLFDHVDPIATVGFSFESSLVLLKSGPAKKQNVPTKPR